MEDGEQIHIGKWNLLGNEWDCYLLNPQDSELNKEHSWGRANEVNQKIFINAKLKSDSREETLLHELLHIINYRLGLDFNEHTIAQLATILYPVLVEADLWKSISWPDKEEQSP